MTTVQAAVRGVGGIWCPRDVRAAMRVGVWAVTQWLDWQDRTHRGRWGVTHVPSGIQASHGWLTLREARALCRRLGEELPDFGKSARFGVLPKKRTSERWLRAREICRSAS